MSAVGQFTTLHGETRLPLPRREATASAVGGAPGSAVCAADWAYLVEALAERRERVSSGGPSTFDVYPHALLEFYPQLPDYTARWFPHWRANELARSLTDYFADPDWTPPATLDDAIAGDFRDKWVYDSSKPFHLTLSQRSLSASPSGWYPFGSVYSGVDYHEYQYRSYTSAGRINRRADDLRRMFYDLKRMRRRLLKVSVHRTVSSSFHANPPQRFASWELSRSSDGSISHEDVCDFTTYTVGDILNLEQGVAVSAILSGRTFAIVEAEYWWKNIDTEDIHAGVAWFATPATLATSGSAGSVTVSGWTSADLRAWLDGMYRIDGRTSFRVSAKLWGDETGTYGETSTDGHAYLFSDVTFPIDAQIFGSSDSWVWTPATP